MIGPHVLKDTDAALTWARNACIVKGVDTTAPLQVAPDASIRVFRHYFTDQEQANLTAAAAVGAAAAVQTALGGYRHPLLYVEAYNEVGQSGQALHDHAYEFMPTFVDRCHKAGLKVAGFSFSTGQPEQDAWQLLREAGYAGVDVLALHQYWGGEGFTPWEALRHRQVHAWTEGDHPDFIITETGIDAIEGGTAGWRKDNLSPVGYVEELADYARELAQDEYVVGACVFTAGAAGGDWWAYDTDGLDVSPLYGWPCHQPRPYQRKQQQPSPALLWPGRHHPTAARS